MKKRTLALLLATLLLLTMAFSGCSGGGESSTSGETSGDASTSEASGETSDTPEFLDLSGNLPIITDQEAFEEANGGPITVACSG